MESFLESLSLALSEQTGFTPETCYLLVLDLLRARDYRTRCS